MPEARLLLGSLHDSIGGIIGGLQSLKVVEYSGPATDIKSYCSDNVRIRVHAYQLYDTRGSTGDDDGLPQANVTSLPHFMFEGQWDE